MKRTIYLHAQISPSSKGGISYKAGDMDMSEFWGPIVRTQEVEFDVENIKPDDLIPATISRMRKEQAEIRAEAERKTAQIEEKISKMLALEFTP